MLKASRETSGPCGQKPVNRMRQSWLSDVARIGLVFVAAMVLLTGSQLNAQIDTGIIVGTIKDPSGAVIPKAQLTVTNTDLQSSVKVETDATGAYVTPALKPGPYEIRVESQGFQTGILKGITLHVQERLQLDATLQPGKVTEQVVVQETAPVLQTRAADMGTVVEQRRIEDLPLNGRHYSDLILLSAGAVPAPDNGNPREAKLNVNGNFSLQNYFALNGIDNNGFTENVQERSPQAVQPPPDALKEFRVQTRTYSAEFGWFQGAVINAEIRSGANQLHGDLWEFHRNQHLDANDFFSNAGGLRKGSFLRNQAGFAVAGPLQKDKTFIFGDYQFLRSARSTTLTGTVPETKELAGDFSDVKDLTTPPPFLSVEAPCLNAATQQLNLSATRSDGLPCADPAGAKLAALYPAPNAPGISPFTFASSPKIPDNADSFDVRLDRNISQNDTMFGVYDFYSERAKVETGPFPNPLATGGFTAINRLRGMVLGVTWDHIFRPDLVNDFRLGFNRIRSISAPLAPQGSAAQQFNIPGAPNNQFVFGLPFITVSGFNFLGTAGWRPQFQVSQVYQLLDNLSYIRGTHSYKFGFEYKRLINNYLDIRAPGGELDFPSFWVGDGLANLLLGNVDLEHVSSVVVPHTYIDGYGWYAQDSWRARPNFTLTYGVRYEYFTPYIERNNMTSNFDPHGNGGQGALITAFPNPSSPILPAPKNQGLFSRTLVHPDRNNFAPRIGFAYDYGPRLVLRGGFGVFYQVADRIGSESLLQLNPPFFIDQDEAVTGNQSPLIFLRNGFLPAPTTASLPQVQIRARSFNERAPYSEQFSLGPEFLITKDMSVDVAFVGNYNRKIRKLRDLNQGLIAGNGTGPSVIPFPTFCVTPGQEPCSFIEYLASDGTANYNSLQITLAKRVSHGVAFNIAYTLGKALGNTGDNLSTGLSGGEQVFPQDTYHQNRDYGRLIFDQRNRFVFNYVWELPFGKGQLFLNQGAVATILGGWQLNGIVSLTSGAPVTIDAPDTSNSGGNHNSRANCIGNPFPSGFHQSLSAYFDTRAFALPNSFFFGNCGVDTISSWDFNNWDTSIFKKFNIDEKRYFEFRAEFFNFLNVPQFGAPDTFLTDPTFGVTSSVLKPRDAPARQIQLGLKFYF